MTLLFTAALAAHTHEQQAPINQDDPNPGQCNESDRRDYIYRGNTDFNHTWRTCGKNASGSASGTTACLKRHYQGLSQECAGCFGAYVGCARSNCWNSCWINPDGKDCQNCSNSHCQPGLISCTGIAEDQLPLSKSL